MRTLSILLLLSFAAVAHADGDLPDCIHVSHSARYSAFGYDHVVTVENTCEQRAQCAVSSDVNPQVQRVSVAPGSSEAVLTFRGSPASEFRPNVSCELN